MSELPRHRLWLERLAPGRLVLDGARSHYLRHVLRLSAGERVLLLAGDGRQATAEIASGGGSDPVELIVGEPVTAPVAALELTVAVPAPKGERADWLVEKLTEIGVARLAWMVTTRTVVIPSTGQKAARWLRLAQAAAKQAGRARVPSLCGPLGLDEILQWPAATRYIAEQKGVPLVHELAISMPAASAILLIGPEGGFTPAELSRARASGYIGCGLGPYILRVETAAVAGAAMLLCAADQPSDEPSRRAASTGEAS